MKYEGMKYNIITEMWCIKKRSNVTILIRSLSHSPVSLFEGIIELLGPIFVACSFHALQCSQSIVACSSFYSYPLRNWL